MKPNKLIVLGLLFIITLIASCDTIKKREKLVKEISTLFQENKEIFRLLKGYFAKQDSYSGFAFNYKDDRITLKDGVHSVQIDSIIEVVDNKEVFDILMFMERENIRDISGNEEWIKVNREVAEIPCFSFWYRADFDTTDENVKERINNFRDTKTKRWLYVLEDKWFIKGEACF